jgi:hypothetical protein
MRPTKEKFNLKKSCEKKIGTVGKKIKGRENSQTLYSAG